MAILPSNVAELDPIRLLFFSALPLISIQSIIEDGVGRTII